MQKTTKNSLIRGASACLKRPGWNANVSELWFEGVLAGDNQF